MKLAIFAAGVGAVAMTAAAPGAAWAQAPAPTVPFNAGAAVRQGTESLQPPLPPPAAVPVIPQPAEPPPLTLQGNATLFIRSFVIDGPILVPDDELRAAEEPYENRALTLSQIYEAADKITTLYRNHGYLVAKAYVPQQNASNGVLHIKVVAGRYGAITVKNNSLVKDEHVKGVIDQALAGSSAIQKDQIERAMLETYDLPGAGMPHVTIGPGQQPETSDFLFDVPAGPRVDGYLLGDNYGSPFTGRDRATGNIDVNSPLGIGDRLTGFGIVSEGTRLQDGRVTYSFPLGYSGLRTEFAAFRTTYVLTGTFGVIGATGYADGVSASLSYPLRRQRDDSIYVSANFSHEWLNDEVLDASVANRTIDLGRVMVARNTVGTLGGHEFTTSATFALTIGSVDFGSALQKAADIAGPNIQGGYAKVNASFDMTLALAKKWSVAASFRGQQSLTENLDSSEQMSLTGYYGVRSYDEGLSGDSGFLVTPSVKYALPDLAAYRHSLGVFTDVGAVVLQNASFTTTQKPSTELNDVGVGYYGTYEYSQGRYLLVKAELAHTYGVTYGQQIYNRGTKGLFQVGFTF